MSDELRKITKLTRSKESIIIEFQKDHRTGRTDSDKKKRNDPALDTFHDAFNALEEDVKLILDNQLKMGEVFVSQISLKWQGGRIADLVISAQKTLKTTNGVLNIHTPLLSAPEEGKENKKVKCLASATIIRIEKLIAETMRYLSGERKQLALDFVDKKADEADKKDVLVDAVDVIIETDRATVASLTRRLKLSDVKAAKVMSELEEAGIVGAVNGNKAREILIKTKEEAIELLKAKAA